MEYKFKHLALGGTFDLLHRGHKEFLEFAFDRAAKVSVGITTDKMVINNEKPSVKNLSARLRELEDFLKQKGFITRSKIVLLDDVFGSSLTDKTIEGLVVTSETLKGGFLINKKRKALGLGSLPLIRCPMVKSNDGEFISSTRIKNGSIDREGFSYYKLLLSAKKFILPQDLRQELSKIQGRLITSVDQIKRVEGNQFVTVGDEVTSNFVKAENLPNLAIIDFKINRKEIFANLTDLGYKSGQDFEKAENEPGTIDHSLVKSIYKFFIGNLNHPFIIKVNGEEDLAVLPVVLLAPLGTKVYYGQRGEGLVLVEVTEAKKAEFVKILKRFGVQH